MYHVSLAVIYTARGRMGESLYWPKADFKQSLMEREPRAKERENKLKKRKTERKKTKGKNNCTNEQTDNLTRDVGTFS